MANNNDEKDPLHNRYNDQLVGFRLIDWSSRSSYLQKITTQLEERKQRYYIRSISTQEDVERLCTVRFCVSCGRRLSIYNAPGHVQSVP